LQIFGSLIFSSLRIINSLLMSSHIWKFSKSCSSFRSI
jgi:hypothetical protein